MKNKKTLKFDTLAEYKEWKIKAIPHTAVVDLSTQKIWIRFQNV